MGPGFESQRDHEAPTKSEFFFVDRSFDQFPATKYRILEPQCAATIEPPSWHPGTQQIAITRIGEIGTFQLNAEKF